MLVLSINRSNGITIFNEPQYGKLQYNFKKKQPAEDQKLLFKPRGANIFPAGELKLSKFNVL